MRTTHIHKAFEKVRKATARKNVQNGEKQICKHVIKDPLGLEGTIFFYINGR